GVGSYHAGCTESFQFISANTNRAKDFRIVLAQLRRTHRLTRLDFAKDQRESDMWQRVARPAQAVPDQAACHELWIAGDLSEQVYRRHRHIRLAVNAEPLVAGASEEELSQQPFH